MTYPSKQTRRRFSAQTKLAIVHEALSGEQSKAAIARKYDVNANQLSRWIREYERNATWRSASPTLLPVMATDNAPPHLASRPSRQNHDTDAGLVVRIQTPSGHCVTLSGIELAGLSSLFEALR